MWRNRVDTVLFELVIESNAVMGPITNEMFRLRIEV